MIVDLNTAMEYAYRHPNVKEVIVPTHIFEKIRDEMEDRLAVRPSPRPTYGPPHGDIDRMLWDSLQDGRKRAPVYVRGMKITDAQNALASKR